MKLYPIIVGVSVLVTIFSFYYLYLWQHEQVHYQLCVYAGGEPSIDMFSGIASAQTVCEIEEEGIEYERLQEYSGLTEIVGYHLLPFYALLSIITVISIVNASRAW